MLIGHASVTGPTGSPFIEAFCNSVEESFEEKTFINIYQDIQDAVSKKLTKVYEPVNGRVVDAMQVPEMQSTLRHQLYLVNQGKFFCLD